MFNKCRTCGGIYPRTQPDGSEYYHACAPLPFVRVRREDGTRATIPRTELLDTDQVIREILRERPNRRDENTLRRGGDRGEIRIIRAEGLGVDAVAPPADDE